MALSKAMLRGMGLSDEQISAIIEGHMDSIRALQDERDGYKTDAEKLKDVQKELNDLKEKGTGSEWEEKYIKEHDAFESYKTEQDKKDVLRAKEASYRNLIAELGIKPSVADKVVKFADLESLELDEKGALKDADKLTESIKEEYSDFIPTITQRGATTPTPPSNDLGGSEVHSIPNIF